MQSPFPMYRTAIVYDFDGTLARGNVQEHSFMPSLGIQPEQFWKQTNHLAKKHNSDTILTFMWRMLEEARAKNTPITCHGLRRHGQDIPLFDGVDSWFYRVNQHAKQHQLALEHYVVSSGNAEIIDGCRVRNCFKEVFASKFIYNDEGEAISPGAAINYTTKTQYLFRINKEVLNHWDNDSVNRWQPLDERPIPFTRMIFIGDGDTDIPSMKMVRFQGGFSIAVYDPQEWQAQSPKQRQKLYKLISEDRVNFVAPADYTENSQLEVIVKGILGRFARDIDYRGSNHRNHKIK